MAEESINLEIFSNVDGKSNFVTKFDVKMLISKSNGSPGNRMEKCRPAIIYWFSFLKKYL